MYFLFLKVRVLEDMQGIQVFWFSVANDDCKLLEAEDISTEELLKSISPLIRQELVNQRVISIVPPINFKKGQLDIVATCFMYCHIICSNYAKSYSKV